MVQFAWRDAFAHLHQSGQRDDGIVAATHVNLVNVFRRVAATGLRLHDHVVLLCIAFVAGHVATAQQGFNRLGDDFDTHAQIGRFLAIDIDAQLWLVQSQVDVGRHNARIFGDFVKHLAHHAVQVLVTFRGLDDEVERSLAKTLTERRRRDREGCDA